MTPKTSHVTRILIAGVLAAFPLIATIALLMFVAGFVVNLFGPSSTIGHLFSALGLGIANQEWVGYVLGLALMVLGIFVLGLLVEKGLQTGFTALINAIVRRIPIVSTIYETIHRFVDLVSKKDESDMKSMKPVWCHFGGKGGAAALALLSSPEAVLVDGVPSLAVIIPTAPVPIGGGLLYVPTDWVSPADVGMDALTSLYVSMGVTSPQYLKKAEHPTRVAR